MAKRMGTRTRLLTTKFWIPKVNLADPPGKRLASLDRATLGPAIQLITGHCWLKRHTALIEHEYQRLEEIDDEAVTCRICNITPVNPDDMETPIHLVSNCSAVKSRIQEIFEPKGQEDCHITSGDRVPYTFIDKTLNFAWSIISLIQFSRTPFMNQLDGTRHRAKVPPENSISQAPVPRQVPGRGMWGGQFPRQRASP